ncbi:hypothetical protein Q8F55_002717 [Vanrija albida]|uniref:BTB domain-containing protein n=1 Tax=Vanrija albida TaxID=181172 RepID=A0ABR3QAK8_9TREE
MPKVPRQLTTRVHQPAAQLTYTPDEPAPLPVDIVDDKKWVTGDFSLVNSDNVRFRVDSLALFVARWVPHPVCIPANPSPVFRAAGEVSSGDKAVHLTDPDFETATTVRAFLDFVLNFRFPMLPKTHSWKPPPLDSVPPVVRLAFFMDKYDCRLELRRLEWVFYHHRMFRDSYPAFTRDWFILAALSKNVEVCAGAIIDTLTKFVGDKANEGGGNAYTDTAALIPANITQAVKDTIPANYLAALIAGWEKSGRNRGRLEWAKQFKAHLKP